MIDYKITRAVANIGQIEVTYFHEGTLLGVFAIDVPVENGAFLSGEALHVEIMHRAPTWLINRQAEVTTATGFDLIQVEAVETPLISDDAQANAAMWEQVEFEKRIAKALVKFGVLASNPTAIDVAVL